MKAERWSWLLYPVLLSLGAGALASCAPEQTPPPQAAAVHPLSPPPPPEKPPPHPPAPHPARKPVPPSPIEGPAAAAAGALAMTTPKPAAEAPAPEQSSQPADPAPISTSGGAAGSLAPQTSELIGLDEAAATRLFGAAAERSEQPPATVWRYKSANCELDLFFYLDLRSGRMRTLHYALKGDGAAAARRQDCLRSLVASRGG